MPRQVNVADTELKWHLLTFNKSKRKVVKYISEDEESKEVEQLKPHKM